MVVVWWEGHTRSFISSYTDSFFLLKALGPLGLGLLNLDSNNINNRTDNLIIEKKNSDI